MQILNEMVIQKDDLSNRSLHSLLFSGKDEVKQLLDIECKYFGFIAIICSRFHCHR